MNIRSFIQTESNFEFSYFMEKENRQIVHVCKDTFLKCLHVGKTRVQSFAKHFFKHGNPRKENRGGDKKSHNFKDKRKAVIEFIKTPPGRESHYSGKTPIKLYLPSELKKI